MQDFKKFNLKFYDQSLHSKLKIQAVHENTTMQDLIIKACKEYLEKVENTKDKK